MNEDNRPVVTISVDEYFDLREKAQINAFMSRELQEVKSDIQGLRDIVYRLEDTITKLKGRECR